MAGANSIQMTNETGYVRNCHMASESLSYTAEPRSIGVVQPASGRVHVQRLRAMAMASTLALTLA